VTIKETVKQALTTLPGNKPFAVCDLVLSSATPVASALLDFKPEQIRRALRDIPYVRKLADGRYVVKGRRVPPKVDITQPNGIEEIKPYSRAAHIKAAAVLGIAAALKTAP
jgi:hypothetical protein